MSEDKRLVRSEIKSDKILLRINWFRNKLLQDTGNIADFVRREAESLFATNQPKLSQVEQEGTPTSSAQIEEPSRYCIENLQILAILDEGDGSSQLQVVLSDVH